MEDNSKALLITRMDGPEDHAPAQLENPSWRDIEVAIRRLDGETCTMLLLGIGDPVPHMGIGGGEAGRYIVYATPDNMIFHNLINPKAAPGKCLLVAGGQMGNYEIKLCVSLAEVLRAAKTYAETGQLESTLTWEEQG